MTALRIGPYDREALRRLAITAVFSDDYLLEKLVLKGGNALALVHRISNRVSLDLDFSISNDFEDVDSVKDRIFAAIKKRFAAEDLEVIDLVFDERPPGSRENRWGGYSVEFKVVTKEHAARTTGLDNLRKGALPIGPDAKSIRIEISKFEFCDDSIEMVFDEFAIRVYSVELIVIEKLRAICQQMPSYRQRAHPTPRAKDFFDIHSALETRMLDLKTSRCAELAREVFSSKDVSLELLLDIEGTADFHRPSWPSVMQTVDPPPQKDFDFYVKYVGNLAASLKLIWMK